MLRCSSHPQSGTVTGDTSVCVKWNCGILAMLDYYNVAAKRQGGIIQDRIYWRFSQCRLQTVIALTVMYWSFYTQIISGMKWSSFRSFQHFESHHKQCPAGGTYLWMLMGIRWSFHTDYAILHATQITQCIMSRSWYIE